MDTISFLIAMFLDPAAAPVLALVLTVVVLALTWANLRTTPLVDPNHVGAIDDLDRPEDDDGLYADPEAEPRVLRPRTRGRYAAWCAREVQTKYGLKPRTEAQECFYREKIVQLMAKNKSLRHTDRVLTMDMALELCFVPTRSTIRAAEFRSGLAVKIREIEHRNAGRGWVWIPCLGWTRSKQSSINDLTTIGNVDCSV